MFRPIAINPSQQNLTMNNNTPSPISDLNLNNLSALKNSSSIQQHQASIFPPTNDGALVKNTDSSSQLKSQKVSIFDRKKSFIG